MARLFWDQIQIEKGIMIMVDIPWLGIVQYLGMGQNDRAANIDMLYSHYFPMLFPLNMFFISFFLVGFIP